MHIFFTIANFISIPTLYGMFLVNKAALSKKILFIYTIYFIEMSIYLKKVVEIGGFIHNKQF